MHLATALLTIIPLLASPTAANCYSARAVLLPIGKTDEDNPRLSVSVFETNLDNSGYDPICTLKVVEIEDDDRQWFMDCNDGYAASYGGVRFGEDEWKNIVAVTKDGDGVTEFEMGNDGEVTYPAPPIGYYFGKGESDDC